MPSPFPGMDPYLEDPDIFPDIHDSFIAYLREMLNARLPAPYYASSNSRVWIEPSHRRIGPDVNVLRPKRHEPESTPAVGGVTATAELLATEPVVVHIAREEVRETYLEIFARRGRDRLVATIEVLSPTNKTPGAKGRGLYRKKQRGVLRRRVHLVEIDLLRAGVHTTAVPRDAALKRTGGFDYHVCVRRFDRPEDFIVYPIRLPQRLPTLSVPLLPDDPPVSVDLQSIFGRCYDTGRCQLRVHYDETPPAPPLSADQQAWAEQLIRSRAAAGEPAPIPTE